MFSLRQGVLISRSLHYNEENRKVSGVDFDSFGTVQHSLYRESVLEKFHCIYTLNSALLALMTFDLIFAAGGNQRELARAKNQKKQAASAKGKSVANKGTGLEKKKKAAEKKDS